VCLPVQGASGAVTEEAKRRSAFLLQLRNRLAAASTEEQEAGSGDSEPELNLTLLVTRHGMEDWMQVRLMHAPQVCRFGKRRLQDGGGAPLDVHAVMSGGSQTLRCRCMTSPCSKHRELSHATFATH
jgi:hypothetical protein